jgi:hypothetical protein
LIDLPKIHYVDKKKLYDDLCDWKIRADAAQAEGLQKPKLPDSVGRVIMDMARHMGSRGNFRNYTFIDEMISDGIVDAVRATNAFDPKRLGKAGEVNPFGFLSLIIWRSFTSRILNERKKQATKVAMMIDPTYETYTSDDGENYDIDQSDVGQFFWDTNS